MLKTKSPADAAANGQTSPADDAYKPGKRLAEHPCCFSNRVSTSRNVCNAKPFAPRLMVLSLPSRKGEETHIESITEEQYHNILRLSSASRYILCRRKIFSKIFRLMQKNKSTASIYYVEPNKRPNLDKRRKPIPCPGSHTGAVDSVPLCALRRISAQRGLKIRGLKRERRKWAGTVHKIFAWQPQTGVV